MKRASMKLFFLLAGAILIAIRSASADESPVTDSMHQRGLVSHGDPARIQAVLAKARRREPICVAAIGGSITAGGTHTKDPSRRYVQQIAKWFEKMFPGLKVRCVNAGIGATNSGYGALRVQRDVIAHQPDLVIVEYAVNDSTGIAKLDESYEGVLRQLLANSTKRAVIELFFMHKDGKSAQPEEEALGRHYGLTMISFRDALWPELQAGTIKWETIYDDVVHPNDAGHDIASELLRGFLNASLDRLPKNDRDLPAIAPVPAPLISDTFARCTMFRAADLKPLSAEGWTRVKLNVWECGNTGGRLEYEVPGRILMLGRTIPAAASNRVELIVDGGTLRPISREGHNLPVATELPSGLHRVAVVVRPFDGAGKVQIWWGGAAGAAQSVEVVTKLRPLSVRGVNYFPRETPWGGMWTKTPPEVFEKDMALAASLGCNTIRTFLQFASHAEQAGLLKPDGSLTAAYHEKFEQLLAAAWRHGIRVIVCFEFSQQWLAAPNAADRWQRALSNIVGKHRDDGRVLMWDLMNEPEDDAKWAEATRGYLRAALPFIKQLDSNHLTTVGLTWRADRLKEVGLPDVMQYHEYAGKDVFFKDGPQRVLVTFGHQRKIGGARPLFIGEFGMSTARDAQHSAAPELRAKMSGATGTEAEQARLYEIVLAGAEQGRAAGALAWCLHDYPIKNPNESHFGLVRADGSLKPAAIVLRETFLRWKRQ